jgi:DNA-directed RNA polymerase subunit H (RpoH/RPB5)
MSNIELNTKEINIIICTNILKMLERRNKINSWNDIFEKIKNDINNKASIDFTFNNNKYSIYIINSKITSIVQGTPLDDYLSSNLDIRKFVVIKETAKKVVKQIVHDYKNTEFFFEYEMLEDMPLKDIIPKHELLNENEKNELLNYFNEHELMIIFNTDPMARYYNAEVGDIFRITRVSNTSGKSIVYRRVHQGSWDILFP